MSRKFSTTRRPDARIFTQPQGTKRRSASLSFRQSRKCRRRRAERRPDTAVALANRQTPVQQLPSSVDFGRSSLHAMLCRGRHDKARYPDRAAGSALDRASRDRRWSRPHTTDSSAASRWSLSCASPHPSQFSALLRPLHVPPAFSARKAARRANMARREPVDLGHDFAEVGGLQNTPSSTRILPSTIVMADVAAAHRMHQIVLQVEIRSFAEQSASCAACRCGRR
jgi:hypothetical protein